MKPAHESPNGEERKDVEAILKGIVCWVALERTHPDNMK
jgi:hypothetical protein